MANATINNTANSNGKLGKFAQIIADAVNGTEVVFGSLAGGNRGVGEGHNGISCRNGDKYYMVVAPETVAEAVKNTRYNLENDGKDGYTPDYVSGKGRLVHRPTKGGKMETFVVANEISVKKGGEGVEQPASVFETDDVPAAAETPVSEAPYAGQLAIQGNGYVQEGGKTANILSSGVTVPVSLPGGVQGYHQKGFGAKVSVASFTEKDGKQGVARFDNVVGELETIRFGEGEGRADYPDVILAHGDFTVTKQGEQRTDPDGKTYAVVKMESSRYPDVKFSIKTYGGNGKVMAKQWALDSEVGDVIRVPAETPAAVEFNGHGFLLTNPNGRNLNQLADKAAAAA